VISTFCSLFLKEDRSRPFRKELKEYLGLIPNEISDQIAAQMLINRITASVVIKAGHNSLRTPITPPVYILQNAAASGVGRLLTQVALDRGVRPNVTIVHQDSPDKYTVVDTVATFQGAKTIAVDPATHTAYLFQPERGPAPAPAVGTPPPTPGKGRLVYRDPAVAGLHEIFNFAPYHGSGMRILIVEADAG
jgi:hypothetical protein